MDVKYHEDVPYVAGVIGCLFGLLNGIHVGGSRIHCQGYTFPTVTGWGRTCLYACKVSRGYLLYTWRFGVAVLWKNGIIRTDRVILISKQSGIYIIYSMVACLLAISLSYVTLSKSSPFVTSLC